MFTVIYQWKLKPGLEKNFREGWRRVTEATHQHYGSLGSRLHKAEDGTWVAYAQWPNKELWENFMQSNLVLDEVGSKMMKESILERNILFKLDVIDDLFK
jgi:quinol monooxygenase YgiN